MDRCPGHGARRPPAAYRLVRAGADRTATGSRRYSALYTAQSSGAASLFADEAVFPGLLVPDRMFAARPDWFYVSPRRGNTGAAKVTIEPVDE